jgi:hypothetical protein
LRHLRLIVFEVNTHAHNDSLFTGALRRALTDHVYPDWIRNMLILDVSPVLGADDYFNIDGHINAVGHAKLAALLEHAIADANAPAQRP